MRVLKWIAAGAVVAGMLGCTTPPAAVGPTPSQTGAVPTAAISASPALGICPFARPISLGAISGHLSYPSDFIPVLALIAVRVDDPQIYRVLHTQRAPPGPTSYTMTAVEPGVYVILAYVEGQGSGLAAAYTAAVSCGGTSNCTDHSLVRVTVRSGETLSGIDVTDWNSVAGAYPSRPPSSDPLRSGDGVRVCNPYADSVNVRASAGLGFPVRRTLDNGTAVAVRDGPLPADGFDWYEVNLAGDPLASGWVIGYALKK